MPLISDPVPVLPAPLVASTPGAISTANFTPGQGTPGALGDTWHSVINGLWTIGKTPFFDTASGAAELTWMRWSRVTQNEAVFKGRQGYNLIDRVTRDFVGLAINFTPTWFQVFPGVDLLAPLSWSQGINGNAAVTSGGNENAGNYALGIAADIYSKYRVDLKYTGYYGNYTTNAAGAANVFSGVNSSLSDRGWVSLTFKTTF